MRELLFFLFCASPLFSHSVQAADEHAHQEEEHEEHGHHGHHGEGEALSHVMLNPDEQKEIGVRVLQTSYGELHQFLYVNGRVRIPHDKIAHIRPRFPAVVIQGFKHVGDKVKQDEVLATLQSNLNLEQFSLHAPFAGFIVEGHLVNGEFLEQGKEVFTIINAETVWVDFLVSPSDLHRLSAGAPVHIEPPEGGEPIKAEIDLVFPVADPETQLVTARAVVENKNDRLHPGHLVQGRVMGSEVKRALLVDRSAIQRIDGEHVVFKETESERFEPTAVELGAGGAEGREIRSGLSEGDRYAAGNTFTLKAELLKGLAHHTH